MNRTNVVIGIILLLLLSSIPISTLGRDGQQYEHCSYDVYVSLTGYVKDKFGNRINNAKVQVSFHQDVSVHNYTDNNGFYRVEGIPWCRCYKTVNVTKNGFRPESVQIYIGPDSQYDFFLEPNIILSVDDDVGADYWHIQDAIDDAYHGDTVYVYNGEYYEDIVINKTINLVGQDRNFTYVYGTQISGIVQVNANHVNISGFTVLPSNEGDSQYYNTRGLVLNSDYNSITGNKIINNVMGIELKESSYNIVSDNIFRNQSGDGIVLFWSSTNNTLVNNTMKNNFLGIFLDRTSGDNFISGNCIENGDTGLYITSSNHLISENTILNHHWYGIDIFSTNNIIFHNTVINNRRGGIYLERKSDNNIITYNILENNSCGIEIGAFSDSCHIAYNLIYNNKYHGIYSLWSTKNLINKNIIYNNNKYGIIIYFSSKFNITENTIFGNKDGIVIYNSSVNNTVSLNHITDNLNNGIMIIDDSNENNIRKNNIENNLVGIGIYNSSRNHVTKNNIFNNSDEQAVVYGSMNCAFFDIIEFFKERNSFHNNFWEKHMLIPTYIKCKLWVKIPNNPESSFYNLCFFDWHPASEPYDIPIGGNI